MMRPLATTLAFASALLAAAGAARAADAIRVGAETPLLEAGPGEGIQHAPHVAYGGGVYLVAWQEGWHGEGGRARTFAARVSPEGKVLDGRGIELAPSEAGVQENPRVAFSGGVFLVVWQDLRSGRDADVLAARVSPEGKLLDAGPIALAAGPANEALPDVAGDGRDFLVVWQSFDPRTAAYEGRGARVSVEGVPGEPVVTGAAPQPRIAWGGDAYLAVYGDGRVTSVKLDRDGRPINPAKWGHEVIRNVRQPRPSLAGIPGKGWLVVVHRSMPDYWGWGGPGGMRCYLVTPEGDLDPSMEPHLKADRAGNWGRLPHWLDAAGHGATTWPWGQSACAFDGRHVVAVWPRHHLVKKVMLANADLFAARLDGWSPIDREGVAVAASASEEQMPALASDGAGRLLCVYQKHQPDGGVLIMVRPLMSFDVQVR
jgi:hypothetical protein